MLTLNLTPSAPLTLCKSNNQKYPVSGSSFQSPDLLNRVQNQTCRFNKQSCQIGGLGTEVVNFGQLYSHPFAFSSRFVNQIPDSSTKTSNFNRALEFPFKFCSKSGLHIAKAAASESESTPEGEVGDASRTKNKSLQLAMLFGLWQAQNLTIYCTPVHWRGKTKSGIYLFGVSIELVYENGKLAPNIAFALRDIHEQHQLVLDVKYPLASCQHGLFAMIARHA